MTASATNPLALIAELTHRCPLHCVYCSNPLELTARSTELPTDTWSSVFQQAAQLGVLQADFTGGEPLARTDILDLVKSARTAGLYVNLITSGLPLDEQKLAQLVAVRPRSHPAQLPRRRRRHRRRNLRHKIPRPKAPRPRMAEKSARRGHAQLRHSSPQHRSNRRNSANRRILKRNQN